MFNTLFRINGNTIIAKRKDVIAFFSVTFHHTVFRFDRRIVSDVRTFSILVVPTTLQISHATFVVRTFWTQRR